MLKLIFNYLHFIKSQLFLFNVRLSFSNRVRILLGSLIKIVLKPLQALNKNLYFKVRKRVIGYLYKNIIVVINNKKFKIRDDIDLMTILADEGIDEFFKVKGKIFLDIGAHIGKYSILYSDYWGKIYAFEPEPSNFENLTVNISLNNLRDKIVPLNFAISNGNTEIDFFLSEYSVTHSIVNKQFSKSIKVKAISLDNFFKDFNINIEEVDLIKIDVEGAENLVLGGMKSCFNKFKGRLIIEIWENNIDSRKFVEKILKEYNFNLKRIKGDYYLAYYENS